MHLSYFTEKEYLFLVFSLSLQTKAEKRINGQCFYIAGSDLKIIAEIISHLTPQRIRKKK